MSTDYTPTEDIFLFKHIPFDILTFVDDWDADRYTLTRILQPQSNFKAQLELHADTHRGSEVVLKRYSMRHLRDSPEAFERTYPGYPENPWNELFFAHKLGMASPFCGLGITPYHGVCRDRSGDVLIVSDHMPLGDLFDFVSSQGQPGAVREAKIRPILEALLLTVSTMHSIGVAHCDLSVENMLLRAPLETETSLGVVLIDFAMAVCGEEAKAKEGIRGKPQYQAPELHYGTYDAYSADLFSCGVVAFSLALGRYPWTSTVPGESEAFSLFKLRGFRSLVKRWPVPGMTGVYAADVLSPGLLKAIATLLNPDPRKRRAAISMILNPS